MSDVDVKPRPKSTAPGQYLGYALQPVRFCYHLLRAPDGYSVSLEKLDDIGIHAPDGTGTLEQTKSALSGNPLADRSSELWKTFANWADLCVDGAVQLSKTNFQIYATPVNSGDFANALHSATTAEAAKKLLTDIKKSVKKGKESVGCNSHILRFLNAGDDICAGIIVRFRLVCENDPADGLRTLLQALIPPKFLDDFCAAVIGQAKDDADRLIRDHKPAEINAAAFRRKFHAFVQKHNLANLLLPTTDAPTKDELKAKMDSSPLFVRQLQVVEASQELLVTAVSDYLRAMADKIKWAADGVIVEGSLNELDDTLERRHKIIRDEVEDVLSHLTPVQRGRALFRRCIDTQVPLEGRVLPDHFVPGAFNILADVCRIGWHPQYTAMFKVK